MQTHSLRLALLASLLLGSPVLSWAKPLATPPGVARAEQAGVAASSDPFSPVVNAPMHPVDPRPLQLPPPPVGGSAFPSPKVNVPVIIGTINGETLVQTSAGVKVLSKAQKTPERPQYQHIQRN